jgi:mannosylglycoprotein endo-beta-mannosidase
MHFKLSRLKDQRGLYWKQRAHVTWLKEGDRNTKFFHSVASGRKKKNRIKVVRREDGVEMKE